MFRLVIDTVVKSKLKLIVRWIRSLSNSDFSSKIDNIYNSHQDTFVKLIDANGDGFISRKEYVEDLTRRFAAI